MLFSRVSGWGAATAAAACSVILHQVATEEAMLLVAAVALLYWLGFAINDYFDASSDAFDSYKERHNVFVRSNFSTTTLRLAIALVLIAPIAVFMSYGTRGGVIFVVADAAMWSYSAPPLRLKNRPGLDVLFCGAFGLTFPYVLPVVLTQQRWLPVDTFLVSIGFVAGIAGQLRQQIRDFDIDAGSEVTFTTTVGLTTAGRLLAASTAIVSILLVTGFVTSAFPWTLAPLAIVSIPVLMDWSCANRRRAMPMRVYELTSVLALCYLLLLIGQSFRN